MIELPRPLRDLGRLAARSPGFVVVAVSTLAIGIGANSAIFSIVHAVLLRPLPFPQSERLVTVGVSAPGLGLDEMPLSEGTYLLYAARAAGLQGLGMYGETAINLVSEPAPERLPAAQVSATLFGVLGIAPSHGRAFSVEDEAPDAPPVVVLSHGLWQRRFGGDPAVVGRSLRIDGQATEVIGVMPPAFRFPAPYVSAWIPLRIDRAAPDNGNFGFPGVGRLKAGVTVEGLRRELSAVIQGLPDAYPDFLSRQQFEPLRFSALVTPLLETEVGRVARTLWVLLGTVGFVLLIACANVANLFLVRADGRQREVAVRTALGATRLHLLRRDLGESLGLAAAGGVLGVALSAAALPLLLRLVPGSLPRSEEIGLDATVLAFTAAISLLAGVLFGAVPALRLSLPQVVALLREGGRGGTPSRARQRARHLLVVAQTALALILLVGSGLMIRSFERLRSLDPGFRPEGVVTMRISLPAATYDSSQKAAGFYQRALDAIAALPGVEAAGAASSLPLSRSQSRSAQVIEGIPLPENALPPVLTHVNASPGYFRAMGIPLRFGRAFERADHEQQTGAVVVSQALAERFWPGVGAGVLGKRVKLGVDDPDEEPNPWYTVVGVVGSVRDRTLVDPPEETVYYPMVGQGEEEGWTVRTMLLALRTGGDPLALAAPVREALWRIDPELPVADVRPMTGLIGDAMARPTFAMLLLAIAAAVALLLGALGIYGVVAYAVGQRTREIGLRMALGAQRRDVSRMVVRQGAALGGAGILLGLAGSLALTRLLAALLFEISPTDPLTFATVAAALFAVALLASYLPAHRAAGVDPMEALREE